MKNAGNAMNGIPLTFDEHQFRRTVIGGKVNKSENALNISVILLTSGGGHFKGPLYENLLSCNFESIVAIEHDPENFSLDDNAKRFPEIKFIVPLEKVTDGELINIAMSEIESDFVLVLRDSLNIPSGFILQHLAERLIKDNSYCIVPRLLDSNKNALHCHYVPSAERKSFIIDSSSTVTDGLKNLYPFDYIALYSRKKFIQLGGFDYTIENPYWQNLDLALRSWLWGEETKLTTLLQFSYIEEVPVEDKTVNMDYLRFYLKNQLPKIKMETGMIKRISFWPFFFRSSCGYLEARRQFNEARSWVKQNKYRFKMDLQTFVENWGK